MRKFLMGAAAIALAASSALADPGNGKGGGDKGGGKGGAGHAAMNHGGGQGGGGGKPDKRPGNDRGNGQANVDRGPQMREFKAEKRSEVRAEKRNNRAVERQAERADRRLERVERREDRREDQRDVRVVRDIRDVRDVRIDRDRDGRIVRTGWRDDGIRRGLVEGCPPGLAGKNNGCMPPGLAKQRDWNYRQAFYQPNWWGYDRLGEGRYYFDDGYLYRVNNTGSILGYVPLLGGALSVGNPWPSYYQPASVPDYYVDYYNLGPANSYRYADDVLYRVDPQSGMIDSIAALLTGDQWAVGQPMPAGYDVYNVPYDYQDRYYDTPDAMYRYSDGYVYQVDPTTQLVQAIIELIV